MTGNDTPHYDLHGVDYTVVSRLCIDIASCYITTTSQPTSVHVCIPIIHSLCGSYTY